MMDAYRADMGLGIGNGNEKLTTTLGGTMTILMVSLMIYYIIRNLSEIHRHE